MCRSGGLRFAQTERRQRKQYGARRSPAVPVIEYHYQGMVSAGVGEFGQFGDGITGERRLSQDLDHDGPGRA